MLKVESSDSSIAIIQDEIRRNPDARYEHRLHAVLLVAQGMSCVKTAELLGDSVRSVEEWVKSFNQIGLQALYDLPVPGRPSRVSAEMLEEIGKVLRASPRDAGLDCVLWDGKALSHWLFAAKGLSLGVRQCQRIFRQLGFRLRKPRPQSAKANQLAQGEYKKTL